MNIAANQADKEELYYNIRNEYSHFKCHLVYVIHWQLLLATLSSTFCKNLVFVGSICSKKKKICKEQTAVLKVAGSWILRLLQNQRLRQAKHGDTDDVQQ